MEASISLNINDVKTHLVTNKFIFPTASSYNSSECGSKGFHTYGPLGVSLKNKIVGVWKELFLTNEIHEIDTPLLQSKEVLTNSGHVGKFNDLIISNGKEIFRADHLVKDFCEKNKIKLEKPIDDLTKDELLFMVKNYKMIENYDNAIIEPKNLMFNFGDLYLRPETAQGMFTEFEHFYDNINSLPFGIAQVGKSYRNEISPQPFVRLKEFTQAEIEYFFDPHNENHSLFDKIKDLNLPLLTSSMQLQNITDSCIFNIEEAVKSNVIVNQIMGYFLGTAYIFSKRLGLDNECVRFRQHLPNELAHYAVQCWDMEIKLCNGNWLECMGIAHRGDYDLKNHNVKNQNVIKEYSKKIIKHKLSIVPNQSKENIRKFHTDFKKKIFDNLEEIKTHPSYEYFKDIILVSETLENLESVIYPNVIEPSIGIDRIIFALANNLLKRRKGDTNRILFNLPLFLAPYDMAIYSLSNNDTLVDFAKKKLSYLTNYFKIHWDYSSVSIGKKYTRSDSIGIGLTITVDFDTINDNTVTLRYSKNGDQIRIHVDEIRETINNLIKN